MGQKIKITKRGGWRKKASQSRSTIEEPSIFTIIFSKIKKFFTGD